MYAEIKFLEWNKAVKAAMALTHSPEVSWYILAIVADEVTIDGDRVFEPVRFTRQHRQATWYCEVDGYRFSHLRCDLSKANFYLEVGQRYSFGG